MPPRGSRTRVIITSSDGEDQASAAVESVQDTMSTTRTTQNKGKLTPISTTARSRALPTKVSRGKPQAPASPKKTSTQAKTTGKPIYSFFNAVADSKKTERVPAISEKTSFTQEDLDAILDDSDEADQHSELAISNLSKGSTVALAVRKRKLQRTQSFDDDSAQLSSGSHKFRKANEGKGVRPDAINEAGKAPWTEQYAPTNLTELAVHHRKVSDTRQWLMDALQGHRRKILVLKGAAGTGKTMTISLLAKELDIELLEWSDANCAEQLSEGAMSSSVRFDDFITRAGRGHKSLRLENSRAGPNVHSSASQLQEKAEKKRWQALLIEEFPNTSSRNSNTLQSFRATITQYLSSRLAADTTPTPIIVIVSETLISTNTSAADSFTVHRLLGSELMSSPNVHIIEFNAIAPTFMVKALETIVLKEARKSGRRMTPGPQVLKQLAEVGDIRSAVSALEFLCLRGDSDQVWSTKIAFTKSKQSRAQKPLTAAEKEALKLITHRESSLGIFHSVGKVVYNKRSEDVQSEVITEETTPLSYYRHARAPETNPNHLVEELSTDIPTFVAALHENYALSCWSPASEDSLVSLTDCVSNLSDSDLLSCENLSLANRSFSGSTIDNLRQDEMCFQLAVRGLQFHLPYPVDRARGAGGKRTDSHRMLYPFSLKLWKQRAEMDGNIDLIVSGISSGIGAAAFTGADTSAISRGVESWRTMRLGGREQSEDPEAVYTPRRLQLEAKAEMVVDRLPYLAHLIESYKKSQWHLSRNLERSLLSVTTFSGIVTITDGDDGDNIDVGDGSHLAQVIGQTIDQGASRQGADGQSQSPQRLSRRKSAHDEAMDARTAITTDVQKLVLEDDDIVDD